ncbi:hypothetical protein CSUI_004751 [Cystoisospora suis]|uniref:Uncharacterized protein n=1 Tax=Cystoisospora suis TaxID=483139 RepID=A0A2C6KW63_9APIC|nr:hypothetical protein CSUI_004751 [Cystoisospora suis]
MKIGFEINVVEVTNQEKRKKERTSEKEVTREMNRQTEIHK